MHEAKTTAATPTKAAVTFPNGDLELHGELYVPSGRGPFPAVVYNHGSEKDPSPYLDQLAAVYVAHGYVFFAPFRRGQGGSPGPYIVDQLTQSAQQKPGVAAQGQLLVDLMKLGLTDQLAGLTYLKTRHEVDKQRIAVEGISYGGIQTLLAAESGAQVGYRAAVDCAGDAESWSSPTNTAMRDTLVEAVQHATLPILYVQAQNDYTTEPTTTFAAASKQANKPFEEMIFPPFGTTTQQGHLFCTAPAEKVWGTLVFAFLKKNLK